MQYLNVLAIAMTASVTFLGAGTVIAGVPTVLNALSSASAADSAQPMQGGNPQNCLVTVDRSFQPDILNVTHQTLDNGNCVCYISTGPASQSQAVETSIADIEKAGRCGEKAPIAEAPSGTSPSSASNGTVPFAAIGAGAVGIGAVIAAEAASKDDSPGG